jgi:hypothetical protein
MSAREHFGLGCIWLIGMGAHPVSRPPQNGSCSGGYDEPLLPAAIEPVNFWRRCPD